MFILLLTMRVTRQTGYQHKPSTAKCCRLLVSYGMITFYGQPFVDVVSQFWLLLFLSHSEPRTLPQLQPALPPFS